MKNPRDSRKSSSEQLGQDTALLIASAKNFLTAAEALRKGLAAAACVMQECPACNRTGAKAALQVWKALDLYEPAALTFLRCIEEASQAVPQSSLLSAPGSGIDKEK